MYQYTKSFYPHIKASKLFDNTFNVLNYAVFVTNSNFDYMFSHKQDHNDQSMQVKANAHGDCNL